VFSFTLLPELSSLKKKKTINKAKCRERSCEFYLFISLLTLKKKGGRFKRRLRGGLRED
jgi:hypothetical protein